MPPAFIPPAQTFDTSSRFERSDRIRHEIACRAEILVNWVRIGFVGAIFLRSALLTSRAVSLSVDLSILVLTVAVSTYFLVRATRRTLTGQDLVGSSFLDVVITVFGLATNVLQPHRDYTGLLHMPDTAVALAVVTLSTLRLSPQATLASALPMTAALYGLAEYDVARNAVLYRHDEYSIFFLLLVSTGLVATILTLRIRKLVRDIGSFGGKLARAEAGLEIVLREHHHAKSTISAALLAAESLERQVRDESDSSAETSLVATAAELSTDLETLIGQLASVRERAFLELEGLYDARATVVEDVLDAAIREVSSRYPRIHIELTAESEVTRTRTFAFVVGGGVGLHRLAVNLLVNACEGDGKATARNVTVSVTRANALGPDTLAILVRDDGPGIPEAWLRGDANASTKTWGSGLGLRLVRGVTEASGGVLLLQNLDIGALATVLLRTEKSAPDASRGAPLAS